MVDQEAGESPNENNQYSIEFNDVVYEVPNRTIGSSTSECLRLIHGFSGKFESGKLTAAMGPSGSCKTTFLDLLVGRNQPGSKTSGQILFRGKERNPRTWSREYAYLEQDDFIIPDQSAYEFIYFAAKCRMLDRAEKEIQELINETMETLKIDHLKDIKLDVVSGGERKRVMIAIEFVVGADILVLDEPTSGLDSNLSLWLIHMLKEYAQKRNKIVIMTIHQPGAGLFEMIDDFYFIYKGAIMYSGPVKEIDKWFDSNGLTISNHLSKPEFLFELFTRNSIFPEVIAHDPTIVRIIDEKEKETNEKYSNCKLYSGGGDFTLDYGINLFHISKLMKRGFSLSFTISGVIGIWLRYTVFSGILLGIFWRNRNFLDADDISMRSLSKDMDLTSKMTFAYSIIKKLPGANTEKPDLIIFHLIVTGTIIIAILLLAVIGNVSGFAKQDYVPREIAKSTYSFGSYYIAFLLSEIIIDMFKILFIIICCTVFKFNMFLQAPIILLFLILLLIVTRITSLMLILVTDKGFISHVMTLLRLFIINVLSNSMICLGVWEFLKNNKVFKPLMYVRLISFVNPCAYFLLWMNSYTVKKSIALFEEFQGETFFLYLIKIPFDSQSEIEKTHEKLCEACFLSTFPSLMVVPLLCITLIGTIAMSYLILRLRFARSLKLNLSK